jgi:hypothetical protein
VRDRRARSSYLTLGDVHARIRRGNSRLGIATEVRQPCSAAGTRVSRRQPPPQHAGITQITLIQLNQRAYKSRAPGMPQPFLAVRGTGPIGRLTFSGYSPASAGEMRASGNTPRPPGSLNLSTNPGIAIFPKISAARSTSAVSGRVMLHHSPGTSPDVADQMRSALNQLLEEDPRRFPRAKRHRASSASIRWKYEYTDCRRSNGCRKSTSRNDCWAELAWGSEYDTDIACRMRDPRRISPSGVIQHRDIVGSMDGRKRVRNPVQVWTQRCCLHFEYMVMNNYEPRRKNRYPDIHSPSLFT